MSMQRAGWLAWAGLLVLQPAWYLWLAPPANGSTGLALALTVPPLLLPLLAMRRGAHRVLLWIGIVSLAYFAHGVVAAWANAAARTPALLEVALCVILVFTLGAMARAGKRARGPRTD